MSGLGIDKATSPRKVEIVAMLCAVMVAGVGLEVERLIALPKVVEVDHVRGAGNRCHSKLVFT